MSAKDNTPKQLSFVGYDRLMGSHYDQYVITYTSVTFKKPDATNFEVASSMSNLCDSFFYLYYTYMHVVLIIFLNVRW